MVTRAETLRRQLSAYDQGMFPDITIYLNIGTESEWMVLWTALAAVGTLSAVFLSLYFASVDLRRQTKQEKLKVLDQAKKISLTLTTIGVEEDEDSEHVATIGFSIFNHSDMAISMITVYRGFPGTHLPDEHIHKTPFLAPGTSSECPIYTITNASWDAPERHAWLTFLDGRGVSWVLDSSGQLRQGFVG